MDSCIARRLEPELISCLNTCVSNGRFVSWPAGTPDWVLPNARLSTGREIAREALLWIRNLPEHFRDGVRSLVLTWPALKIHGDWKVPDRFPYSDIHLPPPPERLSLSYSTFTRHMCVSLPGLREIALCVPAPGHNQRVAWVTEERAAWFMYGFGGTEDRRWFAGWDWRAAREMLILLANGRLDVVRFLYVHKWQLEELKANCCVLGYALEDTPGYPTFNAEMEDPIPPFTGWPDGFPDDGGQEFETVVAVRRQSHEPVSLVPGFVNETVREDMWEAERMQRWQKGQEGMLPYIQRRLLMFVDDVDDVDDMALEPAHE